VSAGGPVPFPERVDADEVSGRVGGNADLVLSTSTTAERNTPARHLARPPSRKLLVIAPRRRILGGSAHQGARAGSR